QVQVAVDGLPVDQVVGAAWYFRTDDGPFEQANLPFQAGTVGDDGTIFTSTLPSGAPACPVAGEYLVRFYLGESFLGEVTGSLEPTLFGSEFESVRDPVEGFDMCSPAGFVVETADVSESDAFTGFIDP